MKFEVLRDELNCVCGGGVRQNKRKKGSSSDDKKEMSEHPYLGEKKSKCPTGEKEKK